MPKVVDVAERREEIADAVFALIERGGIEEASLRNVAAEAGLNIGSVRHYVAGYEGMLIDAAQHMGRRVAARMQARLSAATGSESQPERRELAIDLLEQLLPLDAERRREVVVWLAFCERSRVVPALQREARALIDGSRELAGFLLADSGLSADALRVAVESLASVVDGLAVALLHDPDRFSHDQVRRVLDVQLTTCLDWPG